MSALRATATRNQTARGLVAFFIGVLITVAFVALVEAVAVGLTATHIIRVNTPGEGVAVVVLPLFAAVSLGMPVLMISTVLVYRRLSRQSSNNRWRGP